MHRNIDAFESLGVLQRILLENGTQLFELTAPDEHYHHLICRECHKTERKSSRHSLHLGGLWVTQECAGNKPKSAGKATDGLVTEKIVVMAVGAGIVSIMEHVWSCMGLAHLGMPRKFKTRSFRFYICYRQEHLEDQQPRR